MFVFKENTEPFSLPRKVEWSVPRRIEHKIAKGTVNFVFCHGSTPLNCVEPQDEMGHYLWPVMPTRVLFEFDTLTT